MNFMVLLEGIGDKFLALRQIKSLFLWLLLANLLFGCLGIRNLKNDEKLLYKQSITGNEYISTEELEELYQQKSNKRFPIIPLSPYVWFYQSGLKNFDTAKVEMKRARIISKFDDKIEAKSGHEKKVSKLQQKKSNKIAKQDKKLKDGNLFMRWGEPVSVYDSSFSNLTAEQMQLFVHSKGYFDAKVDYQIRNSLKRVFVTYEVQEGKPFTIDSIIYSPSDSIISKLIAQNIAGNYLRKGDNYNEDNINKERIAITSLLNNNGYYDFSKQYIEYNADTALGNREVIVEMILKKPAKRGFHKVFRIDSVTFTTDQNITARQLKRQSGFYNNIQYRYFENVYSKKILDRRVFIYPGQLYSRELTLNTQRQLANMDIFKFVNINYDSTGSKFIANVYTSPLQKYQLSNELGLNVGSGLPGPFYEFSLKNRNLFRGLEILEINGKIGIEGVASATNEDDVFRSQEASLNFSLTFPQFVFPISNKFKSKLAVLNPKTKVVAGYLFTNRPEYKRTTWNSSISYNWENKQKAVFNFTMAEISFIDSNIKDDAFLQRLEDLGQNIKSSFEPSFVSNLSISGVFNFNSYGTTNQKSGFLRAVIESGGTSYNFFEPTILEKSGLEYYQYLRVNLDYRQSRPITKATTLAYRLHFGIAHPYGDNQTLPYEKFFFAGGSNSIRAWQPRRLGPGSFSPELSINPDDNGLFDYSDEQPAEMLFESSLELRRNIIGFFDAAFFIDAGNVWTLRQQDGRPGASFNPGDFFKEIAVGTGLGLRMNFSFLILRLDAGIKVLDPARPEGSRFVLDKVAFSKPYGSRRERITYNIGIGYPF